MSAGTAYSKRYAGGFADLPSQTTAIDSTFLNAVETALLQLIAAAPTVDGQVAQWDNANTRFGPALILNKNVDPAAAIASSKIDFTGGNALTNAAIAGAAAIARSKLDFGSGLVNADISTSAAIAVSKLASLTGGLTTTIPGSPTDGQIILFTDSTSAPTYFWLLMWANALSKWLFLGGTPQYTEIATSETTSSLTYAALATAGPSLTVVRAGDYYVTLGSTNLINGNIATFHSYDIGGTGAVDADALHQQGLATTGGAYQRTRLKTLAAGTALVSKYKVTSGTVPWESRWMSILPRSIT